MCLRVFGIRTCCRYHKQSHLLRIYTRVEGAQQTIMIAIRATVTASQKLTPSVMCARVTVLHSFLSFSIDASMVQLFELIELSLELQIWY
jgi:hypothetical protein